MHEYIKEYGHCCNACRYYDPMEGYCYKTKSYHYGYDFTYGDGKCPKWKVADDLIQHRQKKEPKPKQMSLFDKEDQK